MRELRDHLLASGHGGLDITRRILIHRDSKKRPACQGMLGKTVEKIPEGGGGFFHVASVPFCCGDPHERIGCGHGFWKLVHHGLQFGDSLCLGQESLRGGILTGRVGEPRSHTSASDHDCGNDCKDEGFVFLPEEIPFQRGVLKDGALENRLLCGFHQAPTSARASSARAVLR